MGPIGCPETSVWNYLYTLRNIPEERRSYLHRGGSLISHISGYLFLICTATSTTECHRLFLDQPCLCVRIIYLSLPKINISQIYNVRTGLANLDWQEGHTISKDWPEGCTCVCMYCKGGGGGERVKLTGTPLFTNTTFLFLPFLKVCIIGSVELLCSFIGTIPVTEGRGYFARRPHVGQRWVRDKNILFLYTEEVATTCKQ
jgi:hypothetical protein